jgi:hypothetical protein
VFWTAYTELEDKAFEEFKNAWPTGFDKLAGPMDELDSYCRIVVLHDWNDDASTVLTKMKEFLRRIFAFLIERQTLDLKNKWNYAEDFCLSTNTTDFTPQDWSLIWSSYGIMGYSRHFCEDFGKEKILFERMAQDAHAWGSMHHSVPTDQNEKVSKTPPTECKKCQGALYSSGNARKSCSNCNIVYCADNGPQYCVDCGSKVTAPSCCGYIYQGPTLTKRAFDPCYVSTGEITPFPEKIQDKLLHVKVPSSLSDPSHVAHTVWKYCKCKEKLSSVSIRG